MGPLQPIPRGTAIYFQKFPEGKSMSLLDIFIPYTSRPSHQVQYDNA